MDLVAEMREAGWVRRRALVQGREEWHLSSVNVCRRTPKTFFFFEEE